MRMGLSNRQFTVYALLVWLVLTLCTLSYLNLWLPASTSTETILRPEVRRLLGGDYGPHRPKVLELVTNDDVLQLGIVLSSDHHRMRWSAAMVLGMMGEKGKGGVAALLRALKHEDEFTRQFAATALGDIGAFPETVVPALQEASRDDHPEARWAATQALRKMQTVGLKTDLR